MKKIMLLLFLGLVIFGCTSNENVQTNDQTDTQVQETDTQTDETQDGEMETPKDFSDMGYVELLESGESLECDIVSEGYSSKVYMKGEDLIRVETQTNEPSCERVISVFNSDEMYIGCEGQEYIEGTSCDWLFVEVSDEDVESESYDSTGADLEDVPPAQIECKNWQFDSSMFEVSGKACTFEELFPGLGDYN